MSDATSVDATSVLFGLEDEFRVLDLRRIDQRTVMVIIEQTAREGPCPACGVITGVVKDRPVICLRDLPASGQRVQLRWRAPAGLCRGVVLAPDVHPGLDR